MKLINVRRGQFVYYENKLHKVYSVNPFLRNSVHIARLSDFEQELVKAREINYYRPKHSIVSFVIANALHWIKTNELV